MSVSLNDAYEFIAYKPRTSSEVAKKLKSRKYDEATIARITGLLTEQKYLDDLGYAISYASEKIRSKPIGRELIRRKLLQKGIDKELIEQALTGMIAGDDETDIARKALEKFVSKQNETDLEGLLAEDPSGPSLERSLENVRPRGVTVHG